MLQALYVYFEFVWLGILTYAHRKKKIHKQGATWKLKKSPKNNKTKKHD